METVLNPTQRDKYYKDKLSDHKDDDRAISNVFNQLMPKFFEKYKSDISNKSHVDQFADYFDNKMKQTCTKTEMEN